MTVRDSPLNYRIQTAETESLQKKSINEIIIYYSYSPRIDINDIISIKSIDMANQPSWEFYYYNNKNLRNSL
jgi:hypothetical protein